MSDQEIEKEIQAKGKTAPRITPADLTANIHHVETVKHVTQSGQVLRWAILVTLSGFAVVGKPSVAVSPENDDAEIGEQIAFDNSRDELWPLMGYALKQHMHQPPVDNAHVAPGCEQFSAADIAANARPPHQQRVMAEHAELVDKTEKLAAFFGTPIFQKVDEAEKNRLRAQVDVMVTYGNILAQRIAAF